LSSDGSGLGIEPGGDLSDELGDAELAELQATAQRLIAQHRTARAALEGSRQ
jgi:hypothetical protein